MEGGLEKKGHVVSHVKKGGNHGAHEEGESPEDHGKSEGNHEEGNGGP